MIINYLKQIFPRLNIMVINQLSVLISIPWIASKLSAEIFGLVSTAIILLQLSWMIIQWGFNHYATEIWSKNLNQFKQNKLVSQLLFAQIYLFIFFIIFSWTLLYFNFINLPWSFFYALVIPIFFGGLFPLWFFTIQKSTIDLVKITLASRILFLFLVFSFVNKDTDAVIYIYIQGISFSIITLFSFYFMVKKYQFKLIVNDFRFGINHIFSCIPFFINSITNNYISCLWGFALSLGSASPVLIGYYSIADHIYRAGLSVTETVGQVAHVFSKDITYINTIFITKIIFVSYILILFLGLIFIEKVILNFFSFDYHGVIFILKLIILAWFFQSVSKLYGYPVLGKLKGPIIVNKIGNIFLVLHLFSMFLWLLTSKDLISLVVILTIINFFHFFIIIFLNFKYKFFK